MDRKIPIEEIRRRRRKLWLRLGVITATIITILIMIILLSRPQVSRDDIKIAIVDRGDIEPSVAASGIVVPSTEEMVICPINSQILEVLHHSGDAVEACVSTLKMPKTNIRKVLTNCKCNTVSSSVSKSTIALILMTST